MLKIIKGTCIDICTLVLVGISRFNSKLVDQLVLVNDLVIECGDMWSEGSLHIINNWIISKKAYKFIWIF